ncbi:MAG: hypothetical protein JXR07_04820 [Reichenbachiella sp.]
MIISTKLPISYILSSTKWDMLWVLFVSISSYILFQYYIDIPDINMAIPTFLGTAISLILGFKLSHSYDRWWEARKIWGSIVNDSRTLVIQLKNFTGTKDIDGIVKKVANRQIAWNYSLGQSLRKEDPYANIEEFLADGELEYLKGQHNVPFAMLDLHSEDISSLHAKGCLNDYQQMQIDKTIVRLCESMGKAERIKNTVFPPTYRIFLHLSIYVFVVMLSEAMVESAGIWEIPRLMLITIPFFFIEKTAYFLQDPFEGRPTDTPLTAIARTIEINIKQLLGMGELPTNKADQGYYVM